VKIAMSTAGLFRSAFSSICPTIALASFVGFLFQAPAAAQDAEADFYKGKTIDFYIGYTPGGAYDIYARLVARHLGNHIAGKPTVVPVNMPGGGGRRVMGYVFNVAPQTGIAIATADQSLVLQQAVDDPSILFDINKISWVGNPLADNNSVATWHTTGVRTVEEAKRTEVVLGATGANTSAQIPEAMNVILGTKFKIATGYPGGNDIYLAMERGEVGARFNSWSAWKAARPAWVRDGKINVLTQIGMSKAPDLPDVPLLMDLATDPADRALLMLLSAPSALGRQIFTSPQIPPSRLKTLRDAFNATVEDPAFLDEAKRMGLDINPVSGAEMQKIVAEILATPKPITDRLRTIIAPAQGDAANQGGK
jgi:tripartite-type tricarboxylate transporter receptor subunit TctC